MVFRMLRFFFFFFALLFLLKTARLVKKAVVAKASALAPKAFFHLFFSYVSCMYLTDNAVNTIKKRVIELTFELEQCSY